MTNSPNLNVRIPADVHERLSSYVDRVAAGADVPAKVVRSAVVARVLALGLDATEKLEAKKAKGGKGGAK